MKYMKFTYIIFTLYCCSICVASDQDTAGDSSLRKSASLSVLFGGSFVGEDLDGDGSVTYSLGGLEIQVQQKAMFVFNHYILEIANIAVKAGGSLMGYKRPTLLEQVMQLPRYLSLLVANREMIGDAYDNPTADNKNYAALLLFYTLFTSVETIASAFNIKDCGFPEWGYKGIAPMMAGGVAMAMVYKLCQDGYIKFIWKKKYD